MQCDVYNDSIILTSKTDNEMLALDELFRSNHPNSGASLSFDAKVRVIKGATNRGVKITIDFLEE